MTFLFDPAKGMDALRALEAGWGGTAQQRLERRYAAYAAERGENVSRPPRRDEDIFDRVEAEARVAARQSQAIADEVIAPRPEANPSGTPNADLGGTGAAPAAAPAPAAAAPAPASAAPAATPPAAGSGPQ
jgi:penicillin-binding protein 2